MDIQRLEDLESFKNVSESSATILVDQKANGEHPRARALGVKLHMISKPNISQRIKSMQEQEH